MLKSILKAFIVTVMSLMLTNIAASEDSTSYCKNGICTMPESVFDNAMDDAHAEGERKGKRKGCPRVLIPYNKSASRGGSSTHYKPGKIWAQMIIPSNFAVSQEFDLWKPSAGTGDKYNKYHFDLSNKIVTYTPGSGENKTTVELKESDWFATVNMGKTGRLFVDWAQDAVLRETIDKPGNFAIVEDMSQPFCSCR